MITLRTRYLYRAAFVLGLALAVAGTVAAQEKTPVFFEPDPGVARVQITADGFSLSNAALSASWRLSNGILRRGEFRDQLAGLSLAGPANPFVFILGGGRALMPSNMIVTSGPTVNDLTPNPDAARLSERLPGKAVVTQFRDSDGLLNVTWHVILRDGSNYLRDEVTVAAADYDVPIIEIRMID
jgi:hypothetical protein